MHELKVKCRRCFSIKEIQQRIDHERSSKQGMLTFLSYKELEGEEGTSWVANSHAFKLPLCMHVTLG